MGRCRMASLRGLTKVPAIEAPRDTFIGIEPERKTVRFADFT